MFDKPNFPNIVEKCAVERKPALKSDVNYYGVKNVNFKKKKDYVIVVLEIK